METFAERERVDRARHLERCAACRNKLRPAIDERGCQGAAEADCCRAESSLWAEKEGEKMKCPECQSGLRTSASHNADGTPERVWCSKCGWEPQKQRVEMAAKQALYLEHRANRFLPCPKCNGEVREWDSPQIAHISGRPGFDRHFPFEDGPAPGGRPTTYSVSSALGQCACGFSGFADWQGGPTRWIEEGRK